MMPPCPDCGSPPPPPEQILPLGIQMERVFSHSPTPLLIGEVPAGILWRCPGALRVDPWFLRFGVIARIPRSCGASRSTDWNTTTPDLRHRAIDARVLELMLDGWI
ncbi:MAG: hypothetical protein M1377_05070 [Deltaproteobacteria bacterium]|nr:hypothetical protein [Deltaproteobacteria bacterium]